MAERGERGKPKDESESIKQPTSVEELNGLLEKYKSRLVDDAKKPLVESIEKGESRLIVDLEAREDRLLREFTVSTVSVICRTADGRRFMLEEGLRMTAPRGYDHHDLRSGKVKPIKIKDSRGYKDLSLSETTLAYAADEAETPFEGAVRGVKEEAILSPLQDCKREKDLERCIEFVRRKLRATRFLLNHRGKDDKKTRYTGLRSKVQDHNYVLEIKQDEISDSCLPITFNESGIPNLLYEASLGKDGLVRYNEFSWREIDIDEHKRIIKPSISYKNEQSEIESDPKDVLKQVMEEEKKKGSFDYERRKLILWLSGGKLDSWQVFIKDFEMIVMPIRAKDLKAYLREKDNWLEEEAVIQEEIYELELRKAKELSRRSKRRHPKPTIFMLRGNTAAGKTTALGQHEEFEDILDDAGKPIGVVNVDTYKAALRKKLKRGGTHVVSHPQVHTEGAIIKARLREELLKNNDLSVVFDERFSWPRTFNDIVEDAKSTGRDVEIIDLDVPLEVSLIRVLTRDREGDEPIVGLDDIVSGFKDIRRGRSEVQRFVREMNHITYYLLGESSQNPIRDIAEKSEKTGGNLREFDRFTNELLQDFDEKKEIIDVLQREISDRYIHRVERNILIYCDDETRERALKLLFANKGKKLFELVVVHAQFEANFD